MISHENAKPKDPRIVRIGGTAAILAGVMRALASLPLGAGDTELQLLYFVIDFLLLLGVITVYAQNHRALGIWGDTGFLITVAGILLVRSSRAIPGWDLYPAGSLAVVTGWVILGATMWKRAGGSVVVPLLFALSAVAGFAGQLTTRPDAWFLVAGIVFGAAMIAVGRRVLIAPDSRSNP